MQQAGTLRALVSKTFARGWAATLGHILFFSFFYLVFVSAVLADPTLFPAWDNVTFHFANFILFGESLANGFGYPLWDPTMAGVPVGVSSINFFPYLPHRLVGYYFYLFTSLDPATVYKAQLVLGVLGVLTAVWFVFRRFAESRAGATVGCLMLALGGSGITVFHQEQMLATMWWMPFFLLCLLGVRRDPRFLAASAVFLGISLTAHYPHIQAIAAAFIVAGLASAGALPWALVRGILSRWLLMLASVVLFALAASPALYVVREAPKYGSPLRAGADMVAGSIEDYAKINAMQRASAQTFYLSNYVKAAKNAIPRDQFLFYVTRIGLGLAVLGVALRPRAALPAVLLLALFTWASAGVTLPGEFSLPVLLYRLRFPYIGAFRQWYHFAHFMNVSIAALGALGFAALLRAVQKRARGTDPAVLSTLLLMLLAVAMFAEARPYLGAYTENKLTHRSAPLPRPTLEGFLRILRSDSSHATVVRIAVPGAEAVPVFMRNESMRIIEGCGRRLFDFPMAATRVYNDAGIEAGARLDAARSLCRGGGISVTVPPALDRDIASLLGRLRPLEGGSPPAEIMTAAARVIKDYEYRFTPRGATVRANLDAGGLLILPVAYNPAFHATLDGGPAPVLSAMGGGMTAIPVTPGRTTVALTLTPSFFEYAVILDYLLLSAVAVFAARSLLRRQ